MATGIPLPDATRLLAAHRCCASASAPAVMRGSGRVVSRSGPALWQGGGVPTPWLQSSDPQPVEEEALATLAAALVKQGIARVPGRWPDHAAAWCAAWRITERARGLDPLCAGLPGLEVVGEFILPPPGPVQRDFQALHIDYGVPKLAGPRVASSRFTALYLDGRRAGSGSATRIVRLGPLLAQRPWADRAVLAGRLRGDAGEGAVVEGILARIIEAADQTYDLPDPAADGFLCGMEFSSLAEEHRYFTRHGLQLTAAEQEIVLSGGELLLFDNLAVAHGRRGRRCSRELHQWCIGFGSLDLTGQARLVDRFLAHFDHPQWQAGCGGC
jgi:hypothetical protein